MKKVSILVPIYGVEKYIEECARSLFEQTYTNIEYIFVNDCTQDRSIEILENVIEDYPSRQAQVHLIQHEHNKGLGAARHTAFQASTGEYVMHVDSDDLLPKDAVQSLVTQAEATHADITDGGYAEWREGKTRATYRPDHVEKKTYLKWMLCQNIISNRIWGRLYRRDLLTEHHIYSIEGIDYSEDYAVVPRAMFFAKRAYIDDIVYDYRTDNINSYTHALSEKNLISHFKACQLVASFFEKEDKKGEYHRSVDIGMVNAYRCAAENKIDFHQVDAICTYPIQDTICKICVALMRKGWKVKTVNYLYLAYRRLINAKHSSKT